LLQRSRDLDQQASALLEWKIIMQLDESADLAYMSDVVNPIWKPRA
jgi:hypothetical protein